MTRTSPGSTASAAVGRTVRMVMRVLASARRQALPAPRASRQTPAGRPDRWALGDPRQLRQARAPHGVGGPFRGQAAEGSWARAARPRDPASAAAPPPAGAGPPPTQAGRGRPPPHPRPPPPSSCAARQRRTLVLGVEREWHDQKQDTDWPHSGSDPEGGAGADLARAASSASQTTIRRARPPAPSRSASNFPTTSARPPSGYTISTSTRSTISRESRPRHGIERRRRCRREDGVPVALGGGMRRGVPHPHDAAARVLFATDPSGGRA